MKVVGYLRVSTEEQSESRLGLEAQRHAIADAAQGRGWEVEWIEDAGFSAKTLKRPGVQRALNSLEQLKVDAIVVAKLDRLSRSVLDFASILEKANRQGWGVVALDFDLDTTTPNGRLVATIIMAVAQWERELAGARTKAALAVKKRQGVRLGRPPSVPDDVLGRIVGLRQAGWTLQKIADTLNAEHVPTGQGGRIWYPGTVRRLLLRVPKEPSASG